MNISQSVYLIIIILLLASIALGVWQIHGILHDQTREKDEGEVEAEIVEAREKEDEERTK